MKLLINEKNKFQPDPFIFENGGKLYIYVSGACGVAAYSADELFGEWKYEGIVAVMDGYVEFWAPSIIEYEGKYYIYVSCENENEFEFMRVASSDSPLGPFDNWKTLYNRFSIDSHVVKTDDGLFLWYAEDNTEGDRIGTRIFLDRLLDPITPANECKEVLVPTRDEEIFMRNRFGDGKDWHTLEGAFWFTDGDWQYLMYSAGCYQNDTYHVGYASAKTTEQNLLKVDFEKHAAFGEFDPVLLKNEYEEGTGHHSVIKYEGQWYAIYHGREIGALSDGEYREARTARVCKLHVADGKITAERYPDRV